MKKKELQSLPVLNATPKIMAAARQNPLQKETVTYGKWQTTHEFYEYGLFIRCAIKNDILMVALYLPEHLCTGGKLPSYTCLLYTSVLRVCQNTIYRKIKRNHIDKINI